MIHARRVERNTAAINGLDEHPGLLDVRQGQALEQPALKPVEQPRFHRAKPCISVIILAQETAALVRPQAGVQAAVCEQAVVIALFNDATFVDHNEPVHGGDGR